MTSEKAHGDSRPVESPRTGTEEREGNPGSGGLSAIAVAQMIRENAW
jgi:hypothetical protein